MNMRSRYVPLPVAVSRFVSRFVILAVALVAVPAISGLSAAEEPLSVSRVFQLKHADVSQAIAAIHPLLSDDGSFTVQMAASRLTVQDRPDVVALIAQVLARLDRPPTQYRVRVDLLEASVGKAQDGGDLFVDPRVRRMFQFDTYRRLGGMVLVGEVGSTARADLGEGYQVTFLGRSVSSAEQVQASAWSMATPAEAMSVPGPGEADVEQSSPRMALRHLTLSRSSIDSTGVEKRVEVVRSNVLLAPGQQTVIGAGASEDSNRAVILIVRLEQMGAR